MSRPEYSVSPKYARGEDVRYIDHFGRNVAGQVRNIRAEWPGGWMNSSKPYLIYTISHPTYRNRAMSVGEDKIISPPKHGTKIA